MKVDTRCPTNRLHKISEIPTTRYRNLSGGRWKDVPGSLLKVVLRDPAVLFGALDSCDGILSWGMDLAQYLALGDSMGSWEDLFGKKQIRTNGRGCFSETNNCPKIGLLPLPLPIPPFPNHQ